MLKKPKKNKGKTALAPRIKKTGGEVPVVENSVVKSMAGLDIISPIVDNEVQQVGPVKNQNVEDSNQLEKKQIQKYFHASCKSLELSDSLAFAYEKSLNENKLPVFQNLPDCLLNYHSSLAKGSRNTVACLLTSSKMKVVQLKIPVSERESVKKHIKIYCLSDILSSGGLLGLLIIHPSYFLQDAESKIRQLVSILLTLEKTLCDLIEERFSPQLNRLSFNLIGSYERQVVLKLMAFDLLVQSIQGGITLAKGKPFPIRSIFSSNIFFWSNELKPIIEKILQQDEWSLRMFSRLLNPLIFFYCYKNNISGYLTKNYISHFSKTTDEDLISSRKALMHEIHRNSPFLTSEVAEVFTLHQKKQNQK